MTGSVSPPKVVRFGSFEVDLPAGHLRKHGIRLKLVDQSFEVLAVLLEHAGEVVTREDLRRRLWPEDVLVDFYHNLNTAVARLREALSDSADHPRFIETLPKQGYRFIADLAKPGPATPRLLVLPFANLSGDPALEYFSDAVTEEIIGALAGLAPGHLAVIGRTTAMHYKGSHRGIARIGRELGVDYVVEGSVRRSDGRFAARVQLIQVSDQAHLWTNRYYAELRDLFSIESAAAQAIAAQIGVTPSRSARKPTEDLLAYNFYIQGRYHLCKGTADDLAKAKQYFEQAIARAPEFALAYDSLAEVYWYWGFFGHVPPRQACSAGIGHALRALEIDNTLAETHALLGMYRMELDYAWPEVRREMDRALELSPASPLVRPRYAISGLLPHGRVEEAAAELEEALESDPRSAFIRSWLGMALWLGRHYDRAMEQARILLELDPSGYLSHFAAGLYYVEKGMFDDAIAAHRKAVDLSGGSPLMLGWLGMTLAWSGEKEEARAILAFLHLIAANAYVPPTSFAWIHLGLGEMDDAFTWMDRAVDGRDPMMIPIKTYPFLDPVRADPRYLALLGKLNLEP